MPPAKERIKQYKCKNLMSASTVGKRPMQSAIGGKPPAGRFGGQQGLRTITGIKSAADFKVMPSSTKDGVRPITAGIASQFGISEAQTAAGSNLTQSVTGLAV